MTRNLSGGLALLLCSMTACGHGSPYIEQPRLHPGLVTAKVATPEAYPAVVEFGGELYGSGQLRDSRINALAPTNLGDINEVYEVSTTEPYPWIYARFDREGNLYFQSDAGLNSLSPSYELNWQLPNAGIEAVGQDNVVRSGDATGLRGISLDGDVLWQAPITDGDPYWGGSLIGADGTLYRVGVHSQQVLAFDRTGSLLWTYTDRDDVGAGAIDQSGNLYFVAHLLDDGTYTDNIPWSEAWLVSLDRDGGTRFRLAFPGETSSPVMVAADGTLVLGDDGGTIHRYSNTGQELWHSAPDLGQPLALLPDGGIVYNAGKFYQGVNEPLFAHPLAALDRAGNQLWQTTAAYWQVYSVTVDRDGKVIARIPEGASWDETPQPGELLVIEHDGTVHSLDISTASPDEGYGGGVLSPDGRLLLFRGHKIYEVTEPLVHNA